LIILSLDASRHLNRPSVFLAKTQVSEPWLDQI
jgi:hypothetical protein